ACRACSAVPEVCRPGHGDDAAVTPDPPCIHACRNGLLPVVRVLPSARWVVISQETSPIRVRQLTLCGILACTVFVATASVANGQPGETFTATATVKTAGGASATAPTPITVDRTMPQTEADGLAAAFKSGGVSGLRKALKGTKPTGSVTLGTGNTTPRP